MGYFDQYGLSPYLSDGDDVYLEATIAADLEWVPNGPLLNRDNFSTDFDAIEILNGKRFELIRTPTQPELDAYASDQSSINTYDLDA